MKQAVCVGINRYANYPQDTLRGCVRDARQMGLLMVQPLSLFDSQATKKAIITALETMVSKAHPGDYVAFTQSGHGTLVADYDGGLIPAFCCHDIAEVDGDWDRNTIITAHELRAVFAKLTPGALAEIWLDTCHSGSGLRGLGLSYSRAKFLSHPRIMDSAATKTFLSQPENTVLWAACGKDQTSADALIDHYWRGAFTYYWLDNYREGQTRHDHILKVKAVMAANHYQQEPRVQCTGQLALQPCGV